jgi:hypothetical protein
MASRLFEITNELVRFLSFFFFVDQMPKHAFVFLEACICASRVFWHLTDLSQVSVCMRLMWRLPSLSAIGAVTTLSAAALAAAALILFSRASFPAFSLRLVAVVAITMRRGLQELCEGAISCPIFLA